MFFFAIIAAKRNGCAKKRDPLYRGGSATVYVVVNEIHGSAYVFMSVASVHPVKIVSLMRPRDTLIKPEKSFASLIYRGRFYLRNLRRIT